MKHTYCFLLMLLLGTAPLMSGCQSHDTSENIKPITVHAVTVQRMNVPDVLELNGIVNPEPNQSAKVAAVVSGVLTQVRPRVGDWVNQGEVVARLQQSVQSAQVEQARAAYQMASANLLKTRTGSRPQEIEQAQAALEAAQANLLNAQKNRDRLQKLLEDNIAAGKDVDFAISQEKAAKAQVQVAQANLSLVLKGPRKEDRLAAVAQANQAAASLSQARANLDFTRILSPISGVVAERYLNTGDQAGPATPIILVVNPHEVLIQASMPVGYNARVVPGQTVEVIPPDRTQTLAGKVLSVGVKVDPVTNTLPVQIEAVNPTQALKIGMAVKSRIVLAEHLNSLVVPRQCLISSSEKPDQYLVNRVEHGISVPVQVQPGVTVGDQVEILSGLQPGDQVITDVGYELPEKTRVVVK